MPGESCLAGMYEVQSRFDEAEKLYTTVLNAKTASFGEGNWNTLGTWANITSLCTDQGRLEEADEARVRTLKNREIRQKVLGRDQLEALLDLHDLAIVRMRRGYITNAIDSMSQCLWRIN
ncbi:beta transducin-like protein HET-E4s [Penicillium canescens]|nr:beta transducin-like protein HET-E4s [Penicillium canescens]